MKKVFVRLPRSVVDSDTGRRIILNSSETYFVDTDKDFDYKNGSLKKKDMQRLNSDDKLVCGKDSFFVFDPSFIDEYKRIKRGAQIITIKDIGAIIANAGINCDSLIMDAGSGSGALSCFLAKIAKKVDSFDVEDKNLDVAKQNATKLNINNISFSKKDVYDSKNFDKKEFYDVFTLDVPEPWRALNTARFVLKKGGYLVVYAPNINQIQQTVLSLDESLLHEKTIEVIEREWSVKDKILRPVTKDFGHTAFLCFIRKIN